MRLNNIEDRLLSLFVLVALLDPANIFIKMKTICFVVFILIMFANREKISTKFIKCIILLYLISFISSILGRLQGYEVNESMFVQYLTTYSVLAILFWHYKFDLLNKLFFPSILLSLLTIGLYIVMLFYPDLEAILYAFTIDNNTIFQLSHREYLGVEFISCYYTPLVIITIPYALCLYNTFFENDNKKKNLLLALLFMSALFCGGNRACLFAMTSTIIFVLCLFLYNNKVYKRTAFILVPILFFVIANILYSAATEKEESNEVKWGHLESYRILYEDNPLLLITGMGAGGLFYSKGFGEKTALVEWQYLEIIRWYGLFGGCFVILFCLYPPIYIITHKKKFSKWFPFVLGYSNFMLMSIGNPYLMNSTGMIAVLTGYTYIYHHTSVH